MTPITPAAISRNADGTPFSALYGDVYHSDGGAVAQARHVFLGGNALPARWAHQTLFTIVETGFGLGLNFLATWQAWCDDPARCGRLHFVSLEKHPCSRDDLAALHAPYPQLAGYAARLREYWPPPVAGMHRLTFEGGRVMLTLVYADVAQGLRGLRCAADVFYLDGFAPDRNPDMWRSEVMQGCARLARKGATLATYTAARAVRDALAEAGFTACRTAGYGRKRHMLTAHYQPPPWRTPPPPVTPPAERYVIVIGGGLAGAAVSERLAARGFRIALFEAAAAPAAATSGLHAATVHPHVSSDDCLLSRLSRAGFLYTLSAWRALAAAGHGFNWQACGVAQPGADEEDALQMARLLARHGFPAGYIEYLDREALSHRCGLALAHGGYWVPGGAWVQPATLVRAQLAAAGAELRLDTTAARLVRDGSGWRVLDATGASLAAAPVVVLANGAAATTLAPIGQSLKRIRGQLTHLPAHCLPGLSSIVAGIGHLTPAVDGTLVAGSTYDADDDNSAPTLAGHQHNLDLLQRLLPGFSLPAAADCGGSVGFRAAAADRLPLIGAMPDMQAIAGSRERLRGAHLKDIPRLNGVYGAFGYASRGLTWAALGGEYLASLIEGEPLPLEGALADAMDPARFALRALRRQVTS